MPLAKILVAVLLVTLSLAATSQAQPLHASKQAPSSAKSDLRGTESLPLVVKVQPPTPSQEKSTNDETWMTVFTSMLVFIGAIQTYWVFRTVKDDNLTKRAFIFLTTLETYSTRDALYVMPKWENSGSTPTRRMLNYISWYYFPGEIPADFNYPNLDANGVTTNDARYSKFFIGPKATHYGEQLAIPMVWISNLAQGRGKLLVWGWAEYYDLFSKKRRRTEFCNELVILTSQPRDDGNIDHTLRFSLYGEHNGSNDECLKPPMTS